MSALHKLIDLGKQIPFAAQFVNRLATNRICQVIPPRPYAFSCWSHLPKPAAPELAGPVNDYTSWPMLTDRGFSARHLPPASQTYIESLPADAPWLAATPSSPAQVGQITGLFARNGGMKASRSSMLFMFFAQWFTDSVLRVDQHDRRKNTSNHNIDLCQIYGLSEATAHLLRSHQGGRLRSQSINGEEWPDYLGALDASGQWQVKPQYQTLPYVQDGSVFDLYAQWGPERMSRLYATGLERGNSSIGYAAISTLFLREHNRLCAELHARNPGWDDERLFQTARMINTVLLMKLVVQDYINHIAGTDIFLFDPGFAEEENWYRTPWIALEFDLLYRWHGMVPDAIGLGAQSLSPQHYLVNNALLEQSGLAALIATCSSQAAGAIGLQNVPHYLLGAEYAMIKMGRDFRLAPYNQYRRFFGLEPLQSFDELCADPALRQQLQALYGDIEQVEFVVGLFAQQHDDGALFGDLLNTMVAYDAFTQIYTNPLLSRNVYHAASFTQYGMELIEATESVQDLVQRNVAAGAAQASFGFA
ncbi:MAG: hypothetical protein RL748_1939 [Pseudomonadota bacterium]